MPAARARLPFERSFDAEELEAVRRGHTPGTSGEARKWLIECRGDRVFFHRARSGFCIFELELEPLPSGARVEIAWTNRDPKQAGRIDDAFDARLLEFLIDRLLLGRPASYPRP